MKTRYCLAPGFSFIDGSNLTDTAFKAGLLDKSSGEVLLLNAELTTLLGAFQNPASISEVAQLFSGQLLAPAAELEAVIQASIESYIEQGILTSADLLQQQSANAFPTFEPGTSLGNYTIIKPLSISPPVGIYLVRGRSRKRHILKKLVIPPSISPKKARALQHGFNYEFEILRHLNDCPLVNQLIDFNPEKSIGVISYFAGISLRRFIANHKNALTDTDRLAIFRQVIAVMAGVHERKVLHGDLHYSNVLVNKQGQIRLIDFDLAFFWRDRSKRKLWYGGIVDFVPPERLTDDVFHQMAGVPDFQAEVYQIGVLGYYIFQGKLPFEGRTWREQIDAIRHADPIWEVPCSPAIRSIIETALHKEPAKRYASASIMLTDFLQAG